MTTMTAFPAMRPATAYRERPEFRLAGRLVTQDMYNAAHEAKRRGQRVFLVIAERPIYDPRGGIKGVGDDDCGNCEGYGSFVLDVVVGGPFTDMPQVGRRGDDATGVQLSAAWHANGWFQVIRDVYPCPLCGKKEIRL